MFNDTLNTFYLRLYGVRHMVKDHYDSEKGNPLLPHRLLLSINSKGSFICTIPDTSRGVLAGTSIEDGVTVVYELCIVISGLGYKNNGFLRRKKKVILFNDAINTFYLRLYGVGHMVKDHSDSKRGNPLLPHEVLFPISSNGSFICTIPQTG